MAGNIQAKEVAAITLEGNGGNLSTATEVEANDTTLDCRTSGNAEGAMYANFELNAGFGSSPTVGTVVELYLVPALDGTNYAEVDATNHLLQPQCYAGAFVILKSQTAAQRLVILGVPVQPCLYKAYVLNKSGQTMSSTWTLKAIVSYAKYT